MHLLLQQSLFAEHEPPDGAHCEAGPAVGAFVGADVGEGVLGAMGAAVGVVVGAVVGEGVPGAMGPAVGADVGAVVGEGVLDGGGPSDVVVQTAVAMPLSLQMPETMTWSVVEYRLTVRSRPAGWK